MAALLDTAIKAWLESLNLNLPVYRGSGADAADGPRFPRLEVNAGLTVAPDPDGDQGDPAGVHTATDLVQIDLWQLRVTPGSDPPVRAESLTLVPDLERALSRAPQLTSGFGVTATRAVYGLVLRESRSVPDPDPNVLHQAFTVEARRDL